MEVKKNNHDRKLENGFEYKDTIQILYETIPKKRDDQSSILSLIQDSLEITYLYTNEFDFKKYFAMYPDLKLAGIDNELEAYKHWIQSGKNEGRCAGIIGSQSAYIGFEWESYLAINDDLNSIGVITEFDAYMHWCMNGRHDNRRVTQITGLKNKTTTLVKIDIIMDVQIFSEDKYNKQWVKILSDDLTVHLDWKYYLNNYEDLDKAGVNNQYTAFIHCINHGKIEGRIGKKSIAQIESEKKLADLEKQRLADLEKQRLAELEKQRLAELEKMKLPMYIINLQERYDKKIDMINQLKQIEYTDYHFFKACDKNTPIVQQKYEFYETAFKEKTIRTVPMFYQSSVERKVIGSIGAVGLIQ